jgi:hypothetical protein
MKLPVLLALVACLALGVIAASRGVAQSDDVATYLERGRELSKAGHPEQALPYFLLALELAETKQDTDDPALLPILDALAGAHTQAGFYRDAEPVYERALRIQEREATRHQTGIVRTLNKLGQIYEATDRAGDAMALYRRILTTWAPVLGGDHPDVRIAGGRLAKLALQAPTAAAPPPTPSPAPAPAPAPALKDLLQEKPKDTTMAAVPPAPPQPEAKPEPKPEPQPKPEAKPEPKSAQPAAPPPAPAKPVPQAAPAPRSKPATKPPPQAAAAQPAEPPPPQVAKPEPPQAAARDGPGFAIHLTSIRNPDNAQAEWNRLRRLYGQLLSGLELRVARADLGTPRGVYYRIKGGTLDAVGAKERCAAFLASGVWCDVTRDESGAAPAQVAANGAAALPPADSAEGGYLIHLTSIRKAEDAAKEWQRLKRVHGHLLDGLELKVKRADLGPTKGVYYRIEAGPLNRGQARALCGQFSARKVWCRVVGPGEEASEGPLRYALQRVRRRTPSRDRGPGRLRSGILMRTRWRDRGCRRSPFAAFMR